MTPAQHACSGALQVWGQRLGDLDSDSSGGCPIWWLAAGQEASWRAPPARVGGAHADTHHLYLFVYLFILSIPCVVDLAVGWVADNGGSGGAPSRPPPTPLFERAPRRGGRGRRPSKTWILGSPRPGLPLTCRSHSPNCARVATCRTSYRRAVQDTEWSSDPIELLAPDDRG